MLLFSIKSVFDGCTPRGLISAFCCFYCRRCARACLSRYIAASSSALGLGLCRRPLQIERECTEQDQSAVNNTEFRVVDGDLDSHPYSG